MTLNHPPQLRAAKTAYRTGLGLAPLVPAVLGVSLDTEAIPMTFELYLPPESCLDFVVTA
jgi:hypothetical protein